jgi:hypothetical protein
MSVRIRQDRHRALFGMLHHIFKNGWKLQYIHDRVYGADRSAKR